MVSTLHKYHLKVYGFRVDLEPNNGVIIFPVDWGHEPRESQSWVTLSEMVRTWDRKMSHRETLRWRLQQQHSQSSCQRRDHWRLRFLKRTNQSGRFRMWQGWWRWSRPWGLSCSQIFSRSHCDIFHHYYMLSDDKPDLMMITMRPMNKRDTQKQGQPPPLPGGGHDAKMILRPKVRKCIM